ncbi:MAG TPA: flagellar biosynthesis protein FlgJ [Thermoanaerobacterales bacterium]|nr:flagellar biosynthesis protein FlgJ [Thermoanaerobacterales bacterium]
MNIIHTDISVLPKGLDSAPKIKEDDNLMQTCKEFEAIFINMLFKQMKATIPKSNLFDSGLDREIFESMFYEEISKKIAEGEGIGLASELYRSLVLDK